MTHRGPFQPRPFCDSVTIWEQKEQEIRYGVFCYHISSSGSTLAAVWRASFWILITLVKLLPCATGSEKR